MKQFKGVIFYTKDGSSGFVGGLAAPAFRAQDPEDAARRLLLAQDQAIIDGAYEVQVIEFDPTRDLPHGHYGDRHTTDLRSALAKQALLQPAVDPSPSTDSPEP